MTNILVGCVNYFRQLLKIAVPNKHKRIINYANQGTNQIFTMSVRGLSSTTMMQNMRYHQNFMANRFHKLNLYAKQHKVVYQSQIYSIIDSIKTSNTITSYELCSLLHWCSIASDCLPLERIKMCQHLCLILTLCDVKMYTAHYNAILTLYIANDHDFSPVKLLKEMESKKACPNYITYATCIYYYCNKGNINEALMLIKHMKALRFPITDNICNSLKRGYLQLGNIKTLFDTMDNIQKESIQLTRETYVALMCAYAKYNRICEIKKLIYLCNLKNIHFTNKDILNVIYTFAINNNTTNVNTMYQHLKRKLDVSNSEVNIILKLVEIRQISIAATAFLHICFHNKSQFDHIVNLILKQAIEKCQTAAEITALCSSFSNSQEVFKRHFLTSLHYSLLKGNDLSLALLKVCKCYTVKPHFFWPFLVKKGKNFDLQGILDTLNNMMNDFNISPCVETVAEYVLPFTYRHMSNIRNLLVQCKLSDTIINNAYLLYLLKANKLKDAAAYMQTFRGIYYYKLVADELRCVTVRYNDVNTFLDISCDLVENIESFSISESCDKSLKIRPVCMDKQIYDCIIHFPTHKIWLKRVIGQLANKNIKLKNETINMLAEYFSECRTMDLMDVLQLLSYKKL